ncbi:MAG: SEC-C metal-binding domain-containing protein [Elusimicrobiales bacterium]
MTKISAAALDKAIDDFREEDFETAMGPFAREQGEILEYTTALGEESLGENEQVFLELVVLNLWRVMLATGHKPPQARREVLQALERERLKKLDALFEDGKKEFLNLDALLKSLAGHPQEELARSVAERAFTFSLNEEYDEHVVVALFVSGLAILDSLCGVPPSEKILAEFAGQPPRNWRGISDLRVTEPSSDYTGRLMAGKNFGSLEEMNKFLSENATGKRLEVPPSTPLQAAQDLIYRAMDAHSPYVREQLARQALEISQDCADAYNLLAEEAAVSDEEELELYRKGEAAGARALGGELTELSGELWGHLTARPYMRAKAGIAYSLWELGRRAEAEEALYELLRLNKNDNQGARYSLLAFHAEKHQWDKIEALLERYPGDAAPEWLYMRALAAYALGRTGATAALQTAFAANPHVPDYLLKESEPPEGYSSEGNHIGGEGEAYTYSLTYKKIWSGTPGALVWLKTGRTVLVEPRPGRNELCPCGSGKKYKKCCGR